MDNSLGRLCLDHLNVYRIKFSRCLIGCLVWSCTCLIMYRDLNLLAQRCWIKKVFLFHWTSLSDKLYMNHNALATECTVLCTQTREFIQFLSPCSCICKMFIVLFCCFGWSNCRRHGCLRWSFLNSWNDGNGAADCPI
jgi:hypothetical protein